MRSSSHGPALAAVLTLALALGATAAHAGFGRTVNCFVQCDVPPYNYWLSDTTIADCCSYVSPDGHCCFGTGYSVNGGVAQACQADSAATSPGPGPHATLCAPARAVSPWLPAVPSAPSAAGAALPTAAGTAPGAAPLLSCSDCINICLLQRCGFSEPPACVSAKLPGCQAQCASSCM